MVKNLVSLRERVGDALQTSKSTIQKCLTVTSDMLQPAILSSNVQQISTFNIQSTQMEYSVNFPCGLYNLINLSVNIKSSN